MERNGLERPGDNPDKNLVAETFPQVQPQTARETEAHMISRGMPAMPDSSMLAIINQGLNETFPTANIPPIT